MKTPHWPTPLGYKPIDLGLERVTEALNRLGNPEKKLPPVIHVAGTNGKGSTIAFLKSILESAGYKVHVYTSPHLVEFNERIVLAGKNIKDSYLTDILEECKAASEGIKLTFFEGTTLAAIVAFSRVPADIVLLETGMGGRLDATNIVEKPTLTIITPISYDHMDYLGDSIEKIAGEKAAIIKKGTPCIISKQKDKKILKTIRKIAGDKAPLYFYGEDWSVKKKKDGFVLDGKKFSLPKLVGDHQIINSATAITALKNLKGFSFSNKNIEDGLTSANWPGRLQRISTNHLPEGCELWVDGGHNEDAGKILSEQIDKWGEEKPLYMIVGIKKDKNIEGFLRQFKGKVRLIYSVDIPDEPTSMDKSEISKTAKNIGIGCKEGDSVLDSIKDIKKSKNTTFRILICGSLYLIGTILADKSKSIY